VHNVSNDTETEAHCHIFHQIIRNNKPLIIQVVFNLLALCFQTDQSKELMTMKQEKHCTNTDIIHSPITIHPSIYLIQAARPI